MPTLEQLQAHLATPIQRVTSSYSCKAPAPALRCKDGSTLRVRASYMHYCTPRNDTGPYTHVEVGCCGVVPAWAAYGMGEAPYAYVPLELVAAEIDRHGGFA